VQSAVMVADRMDAKTNFNFEAASDELSSLVPATIGVQKIYRGDNEASVVHDHIVNGVNQGSLLVNFMGHGSVEVWTGDPILSTSDTAEFNNGMRLPVFLMMTCLNGYYQNPARESLAESLVRTDAGGAVAVWASSGMTEPAPQFDMSRALYQQLFGSQPTTLGEAIRKAKSGNPDIDVRRTWILFGDPTMRVR
jgi:peptidase C25-like protein